MPRWKGLTPEQETALSLVAEGRIATGSLVHRNGRMYLAFDYGGADYSNQIYALRRRNLLHWIAERTVGITPKGRTEYERIKARDGLHGAIQRDVVRNGDPSGVGD